MRVSVVFYWFFAVICGIIALLFMPGIILNFKSLLFNTNSSNGVNDFRFATLLLPFLLILLILNTVFLGKNADWVKWIVRICLIILTLLIVMGIFVGISSYWGGFSGGGVNQLIAFAVAFPFLGLLLTTVIMSIGDLGVNNKNLV